MSEEKIDLDERYFAKHKFPEAFAIPEYELAARKLDGDEKAFLWATNTIALLSPAFWFLSFQAHQRSLTFTNSAGEEINLSLWFLVLSTIYTIMAIIYVANLRISRVQGERKIIILRRAHGVRYGENSMILPSNTIEGADNPFAIKVYPGLLSQSAFPVIMLTLFSSLTIFFLIDQAMPKKVAVLERAIHIHKDLEIWMAITWALICLLLYRVKLFERNENFLLKFAQSLSFLFRIPLAENIEYTLYRSRLSVAEAERIGAPTEIVEPIAVLIEDQSFYSHRGISLKGIARALWKRATTGRRSGASTITQQCARTVFLRKLSPAWRRKPVEIALAIWLESRISKKEILKLYLASARFEKGVFGLSAALRHFQLQQPTIGRAEAFFLVERLGNINSQFMSERVRQLLSRAQKEAAITSSDVEQIGEIYTGAISKGLIKKPAGRLPNEITACVLTR